MLFRSHPAAAFAIDPFARECLLTGVDEIGYVLRQEEAIARFESERGRARPQP